MSFPKITYGAGPTTLAFSFPPVHVPAASLEWVGHVNTSDAGVTERIVLRTDAFPVDGGEMRFQALATDVPAWQTFMAWALAGNTFNYYPDASLSSFTTCILADDVKGWKPEFQAQGPWYTWKLRFKTNVAWP